MTMGAWRSIVTLAASVLTMTDTNTASLEAPPLARRPPKAAVLRVIHPADLGWRVTLGDEPITLGRQPDDGSATLTHATVSRRHAQVWWDARGQHVIRDLGSRHGTHVDATAVGAAPHALADGAIVRLGDVFLAYEIAHADASEVDRAMIPGDAGVIAALRTQLARAAADPSAALITGATGTGKEWVARELHRLSGRRGPLVAVNCATLNRELAESQLFGHLRGAFTGATGDHDGWFRQAQGGTLFLDELGELPLALQPKLLRVLEDGLVQAVGATRAIAVDVRVVAATNRDLEAGVAEGAFRRDLLARLGKWTLPLPSLADRRGDLLDWMARLWQGWHQQRGLTTPPLTWTAAAAARLLAAPWPDNLRGLDRLVHALAAARSRQVDLGDLPAWVVAAPSTTAPPSVAPPTTAPPTSPPTPAGDARLPVPTRAEFIAAWEQHAGSVRALARHFGRDRRQIYRWSAAHGLRARDDADDEPS
jgi:transcriptional regulator with GAF, ATPase, and Fis domain